MKLLARPYRDQSRRCAAHGLCAWVILAAVASNGAHVLAQEVGFVGEHIDTEGDLIDKHMIYASLPDVRPAPIAGYADDAAYVRAMADRAEGFVKFAGDDRQERPRVDAWLAAAHWILSYELEPACTRRIHQLDPDDAPVSTDVTAALLRAEIVLQKSNETLDILRTREDTDALWLAAATRKQRTLSAFSRGLGEYLAPSVGENHVSKAREAASALAVLMEDDDERVVAAATLWHATLRARAEDPSAALAVLPMTATDPPKQTLPHAFFARLLRCELLARRGGFGVALALLAKMDEPVGTWFAQGPPRDDALRALAWTKLRVLKMWHTELMKSDANTAEAEWCAQRMQAIITDRLPEDRRTILRISPAIPVIGEEAAAAKVPTPPATDE